MLALDWFDAPPDPARPTAISVNRWSRPLNLEVAVELKWSSTPDWAGAPTTFFPGLQHLYVSDSVWTIGLVRCARPPNPFCRAPYVSGPAHQRSSLMHQSQKTFCKDLYINGLTHHWTGLVRQATEDLLQSSLWTRSSAPPDWFSAPPKSCRVEVQIERSSSTWFGFV